MRVLQLLRSTRHSPPLPGSETRTIVAGRLIHVVATLYLVVTLGEGSRIEPWGVLLMVGAVASNIVLLRLARRGTQSLSLSAGLVVFDSIWSTGLLYYMGLRDVEFYVAYFFVLFLAAVSETLVVAAVGTILVSVGHLYVVFHGDGSGDIWSSAVLVRLLFFFSGAALFGRLGHHVRQERRSSDEMVRLALRDPLTDLANRRTLEAQLEVAFSRVARGGQPVALLALDLDDFKYVNDTHGHALGDEFLQKLAGRLQRFTRTTDTVARLGGDEFAILLTEVSSMEGVLKVAERLKELIAQPVQQGELEITTTATIGIALVDADDFMNVVGWNPATVRRLGQRLITEADRALYRAKQSGKNAVRFYDADLDREVTTRAALATELKGALERGEFALEFQPQIELESRRIVGVEALPRWHHPVRGLLEPAVFVPVAESTGQIQEIGQWVLETACEEAVRWLDLHPAGIPVAANLSAVQFRDPDLARQVIAALHNSGLPSHLLELELTEGVFIHSTPSVTEAFRALHDEVGVRISLDDFGRGFSSLENLCRFPVDKLKVDRLFIDSIEEDPDNRVIVNAVLALANELGLSVIAEGVETETQVSLLVQQGCKLAQGFYFSRPIPAEALLALLEAGSDRIEPLRGPTDLPRASFW